MGKKLSTEFAGESKTITLQQLQPATKQNKQEHNHFNDTQKRGMFQYKTRNTDQ